MFISVASLRPQYFKEITDIKIGRNGNKKPRNIVVT